MDNSHQQQTNDAQFNEVAQEDTGRNPIKTITPGMPELIRHVAAQGAVLLENRVLPLAENTRVAVFGRTQIDWFYTGYGSGGDVNVPYTINLLEGLRNCDRLQVEEKVASAYERWTKEYPADPGNAWGMWPRSYPEMQINEELLQVARSNADHAVIVIGRSSGEDRESLLQKGSYYLTDDEKMMLQQVTTAFSDSVLILNIGSVIDLSFLDDYSFGAVLIAWQGGMESGNAVADIVCGNENPSGCLSDTISMRYEDQPSAQCFAEQEVTEYREDIYVGYRWFETFAPQTVRYPFGYGLSYTKFAIESDMVSELEWDVTVSNIGNYPGRETVMLFVEKPCGKLGKPSRELVAFAKTKLLAVGEKQVVRLKTDLYQIASYDDSGVTGHKNCYVLEEGTYYFYCGEDVRQAVKVNDYQVSDMIVLRQLRANGAPQQKLTVTARKEGMLATRQITPSVSDLKERILANLPEAVPMTGDRGYKLIDVQCGRTTLDEFVAQLNLTELEALSRGGYVMGNPYGVKGNTGVFGGVTESLRNKGIPVISTHDGPSGLRMYDSCSLIPISTLLACTFDTELVEELMVHVAAEMPDKGAGVMLAPGMNIHRNPLCGRNFEYMSEDPYLTGKIAAAYVRGVQSGGCSACPKHFACNNQETNRLYSDSVLSERALREIYLKGFEICVREADPKNIMTSYNKINGVWGHYHYELVQGILREEWAYAGNVMTDWWMRYAPSPEFPEMEGNAYRVRARVDLLMPGARTISDQVFEPDGTLLATYGKPEGITLGEMQESARNVLRCILSMKTLE